MKKLIVGQYVENERAKLLKDINGDPTPGNKPGFILGYKPAPPQQIYQQYLEGQQTSGNFADHLFDKTVPNFERVHEAADFRGGELEKVEAEMDKQNGISDKPDKGSDEKPPY